MKVVIIGGGIAGTTAAESIRKLDADAEITIIEAEAHPLYSRVLLREIVKEKIPRERVFMKQFSWYDEKRIELLLATRVTEINVQNRFVQTDDGREFEYDALLISSGGDVRLAEQDMRGISYFRTLDDTDHMMQLLSEIRLLPDEERKGIVYGGGFIALDYINIFAREGIAQTVLMRSDKFWSKVISAESHAILERHAQAQGVSFRYHVQSLEMQENHDGLTGVVVNGEEQLSARMMGIGIGIVPDNVLLSEAGLALNKGVLANEYLETNVEHIYTAGDVAEALDQVTGRQYIVGNWMNALMQGRCVAKTILGERTAFSLVSSYATDLLGKEIVFIGDVERAAADTVRQYALDEENSIELFDRNGQTVGAVLIGDVKKRQEITNAIKSKAYYE